MDNPALYRTLGHRIASARSRVLAQGKPLSQSALAKRVGLTRGSIANIELGNQRPPLHVIWSIGQALGIEPSSLLPRLGELGEEAQSLVADATLEPQVERVIEEIPIARAWLSVTRRVVGPAQTDRSRKRRQT